VRAEAVLRVVQLVFDADAVARDLREDGRGGDGRHLGIAADDGLGVDTDVRQAVAVHQHPVRRQPQALDGALHREHGGVQDVELVDLGDAGLGDAERQRMRADLVEQAFAPGRAQQLGVVEALDALQVVEDHRGGHDRAGQRPAAGLVDARDQAVVAVEAQRDLLRL